MESGALAEPPPETVALFKSGEAALAATFTATATCGIDEAKAVQALLGAARR